MSKSIVPIAKDTVHRICSGQVVLNLAIALKELVENSLDAMATTIDVRLREYGSELIEVVDNGTGIHPDNFEALALKHYTSKLRDFGDLVNVETFGFRGEALSSLCAVGELVVITRHETEQCGSKLIFDSMGVLREKKPCPRQVGTTITLTNLFISLPVRQKEFHRNLKKEFSKATQLLSSYCLIATNVKITCVNQTKKGGRTTFLCTQNNSSIRQNISCVFGSKQLSNLLEIIHTNPSDEILDEFSIGDQNWDIFKLEGYISSCEHGNGRSSTDRQFFFINSRPCDINKVVKMTNEIYHRYNSHQYPFVLLNISIPKESVDVNVTPDKRLIFFEHEKALLATLKSSLIKTFENIPSTYRINAHICNTSDRSFSSEEKTLSKKLEVFCSETFKQKLNERKRVSEESGSSGSSMKQMKLRDIFKPSTTRDIEAQNKYFTESEENVISDCSTEIANTFNIILESSSSQSLSPSSTIDNISKSNSAQSTVDNISQSNSAQSQSYVDNNSEIIGIANSYSYSIHHEASPAKKSQEEVFNKVTSSPDECSEIDKCCESRNELNLLDSQNKSVQVFNEPLADEVWDAKKKIVWDISLNKIVALLGAKKSRKTKELITNRFHAEIVPDKNGLAEEELKKEISKDMFLKMKIVGQFNLGFIITKLENDLFIVDQHATDEKYNFETLQLTTVLTSQKLVVPQDLNLTATNECILQDNVDVLRRNGFEFSIDDSAEVTKKVKLTSIPVSYNWQFGKDDVDEMLFMLQDAPHTLCRPTRIRSMFASRACRKSVMIGTALSVADMRKLINNMNLIEQPWNCPHGRPTMRHLVNLSLLK